MRTAWIAGPVRRSATTAACRSTRPAVCLRCRTIHHASRFAITSVTATSAVPDAGARECAGMGRARPEDASPHRDSLVQPDVRRKADHLDGRPAASAGVRAAFVDGILDRPIRRQRTGSTDHPSEARLVSGGTVYRRAIKRRCSRVLRPPRRSADAHGGRHRSGLSRGATGHDHRLLLVSPPIIRTGCFRATTASRSSAGRRMTFRAICSARTRSSRSTRENRLAAAGHLGGAASIQPEIVSTLAAAEDDPSLERPSRRPQATSQAVPTEPTDGEIHIQPVRGNVYMLVGDGGNIVVQVGSEGRVRRRHRHRRAGGQDARRNPDAERQARAVHRQHQFSPRSHRRQRGAAQGRR